jgi:zinc protease
MIQRTLLGGLFLAASLLMTTASGPAQAESRVEPVTSPGGVEAWLIHEPAVPIVALSLYFRGGASLDPEDRHGLAYMVAGLLDEGAGGLDSSAFQRELEDKAIRLGFDAERDGFSGTLRTLTEHKERAFELLGLALAEPRFDPEPVERIRSQIRTVLARRDQNPNQVAADAWFETAFEGHPYGRRTQGTRATIDAIAADDLHRFTAERFARDNLIVGVAGDITAEQLAPLLDVAFGALPADSTPIEIGTAEPAEIGLLTVRRPLPQATVLFGQAGLARLDPDYYAALVANHILGGGGFGSRLTEEVRERRGLTYSVYSYLSPLRHAPLWLGGFSSSPDQAAEALRVVRDEIARMAQGDVSEEELADAVTYLTGSFPLRLTSNDGVAGLLVGMQIHELGPDFIERRNDLIEAVTLEDVRRVAARLYDPDRLRVVVVGDPPGLEG